MECKAELTGFRDYAHPGISKDADGTVHPRIAWEFAIFGGPNAGTEADYITSTDQSDPTVAALAKAIGTTPRQLLEARSSFLGRTVVYSGMILQTSDGPRGLIEAVAPAPE